MDWEPSEATEPWRSSGGVLALASGDEEYLDKRRLVSVIGMGESSVDVDLCGKLSLGREAAGEVPAEGSSLSSETFRPNESPPYMVTKRGHDTLAGTR